ncbi:hypothetical protein PG997_010608 [Apiospora hydei]|uniref:Uncharacterized protein n=1 Tax=Apiospora hydei TaxID=1337664 RepID=A0ABR1VGP1_9PEZI
MKFLVLMLSMAAAAVLAAPTPAVATANTEVVKVEAEKQPKFELPREVLKDVKADGEMSTVCIASCPLYHISRVALKKQSGWL